MSSRAEQITQAIVAALTTPAMTSVPAARVFRDADSALSSNDWPALLVETGDEFAPQTVLIGRKFRTVDVQVTALAQAGAGAALTAADAAYVEAFGRVMADRTLGGLAFDVLEGQTARASEAYGERVATIRKTYSIQYETAETSLEG